MYTQFSSVTVYTVDMGGDTTGQMSVYKSFCSSKGKSVPRHDYPSNQAYDYSSAYSSTPLYQTAAAYYRNHVVPAFPAANYNNILLMQGTNPGCWAHNANHGSFAAFGGPSVSTPKASFCRGGDRASKRFHIYICSNNNKRLEEDTEEMEGEGEDNVADADDTLLG
jgi:hypothetical protein